jgi:hypothetical protein
MTESQRDRAEAAFGHMQHAAKEVILAAHDALEILDEAVTSAGAGTILNRLDDVRRLVFARRGPTPTTGAAAAAPDGHTAASTPDGHTTASAPDGPSGPPAPAPAPGSTRPRHHSRVERIPVR